MVGTPLCDKAVVNKATFLVPLSCGVLIVFRSVAPTRALDHRFVLVVEIGVPAS